MLSVCYSRLRKISGLELHIFLFSERKTLLTDDRQKVSCNICQRLLPICVIRMQRMPWLIFIVVWFCISKILNETAHQQNFRLVELDVHHYDRHTYKKAYYVYKTSCIPILISSESQTKYTLDANRLQQIRAHLVVVFV